MRFLIVAPELEDTNYRGVQFVTRHVIKALSVLGHQVILLTCHPNVDINVKSAALRDRVLNTYFRQYLQRGASLNHSMLIKKRNPFAEIENITPKGPKSQFFPLVSAFMWSLLVRLTTFKVDKERLSGITLAKYVDEVVNLPSFYRLKSAMPKFLKRIAIDKVAKQVKADVVFVSFPLCLPKLKRAKMVQVVHDLIPFEIADEPVEFEWLTKLAGRIDYVTRNSDIVLTVSEDSKKNLLEVEPHAKLHLIGAAISAFKEELPEYNHDSSVLDRLGLKDKKYLLFISSVEKRKNVHRLLRAFMAIAPENDAVLVISGNKAKGFEEIQKELDGFSEELKKRVVFMGYTSEADKYTLLRHAVALVNPTLYEGFGLPVLEAFALGCPVVASIAGALKEVSGDATLKITDPYSVAQISAALRDILKNEPLRKELVKKGYDQAKKYTEEVMTEQIRKAVETLANTQKR